MQLEREADMEGRENKTELVCIRCPMGCMLTVTGSEDTGLTVTGNTCARGEEYARKELTSPTRTVTTTVRVRNGRHQTVSVKTKTDIPKGRVMDCMAALRDVEMEAPVRIGELILKNAADTGVDVVATKDVKRKENGI